MALNERAREDAQTNGLPGFTEWSPYRPRDFDFERCLALVHDREICEASIFFSRGSDGPGDYTLGHTFAELNLCPRNVRIWKFFQFLASPFTHGSSMP